MNERMLNVADRLDNIHSAYESLQIILAGSDADAVRVYPLLSVLNKEFESALNELNEVRRGKPKLKSVDQMSTI
jgi:hypothetical protein